MQPDRRVATLVSPETVGRVNRARVLQALYDIGPMSRADLARLAGVTRATIGSLVSPMIDRGLLVEGDPAPVDVTGGKPARPLSFSRTGWLGAVHLLPGRIEAALVSADGAVLASAGDRFPAATHDADRVVNSVVSLLDQVLPADRGKMFGVGIAVGGMVDTDAGTIVAVNLAPGLAGLALGPRVSEKIGIPTYIDLHPRAQALGDRWFGQGRGMSSFASIYAAEAIGVGLVLNGTLHRGPAGAGGEIGHSIVQVGGMTCRCGQRGCWETIATSRWLREQAAQLQLPSAHTMTTGPLARLAARGHADAAKLLDSYAGNLAVGITNLQQILAPGLFILHGDVTAGGEQLRAAIERDVRAYVPAHPGGPARIAFAPPNDHATLLGAAALVLSHALELDI